MRVADRIAEIISEHNISDVFMVTGGGAMHLNDAFAKNKKLKITNFHHEQACSMAADGYSRITGNPVCVNVTTGPGGINAINGVFGAWTDSVPMVVISGQVKRETLNFQNSKLRQLGDQENNIVDMVKKITKFSYILKNPNLVDSVVNYAIKLTNFGRPGPVWIDVPIDIQNAKYIKSNQISFKNIETKKLPKSKIKDVDKVIKLLNEAKRPAILVGGGIRASNSLNLFHQFITKTSIPVLTAWNAHDVIHENHRNYIGRPGTIGDRPGNFIAENCDLLLVLGSRLNIRQIGYNFKSFSKNAFKIMVDVDNEELNKKTLNIDFKINSDLNYFLTQLNSRCKTITNSSHDEYLKWSKKIKSSFPVYKDTYSKSQKINPYFFVHTLFKLLGENKTIVTSDGTAVVTTFQASKLKKGQRLFSNSGSASMGFGLPAAIGASIASKNKEVICLEGDGSIQMNIQELATINYHQLPIKIFIFANEGYHSIRQTQSKYFPDNIIGCGPESGLSFPNFELVANAYNIQYFKISKSRNLENELYEILKNSKSLVCEVILDKNQEFEPKASSKILESGKMISAPLYDLYPFLEEKIVNNILNYETNY